MSPEELKAIQQRWDALKTKTNPVGPFNPTFGIAKCWMKNPGIGVPLEAPVNVPTWGEGAVVQAFANGWIRWVPGMAEGEIWLPSAE
jgi:hypothetical protein